MKKVLALLALVLLASCATPVGVFSQKQVSANQYEIQLVGQWSVPQDQIWINWIYRAAELTKAKGYSYFSLSDPTTVKVRPANSMAAPLALQSPDQRQVSASHDAPPEMRSGVYRSDDQAPHQLHVAGRGGGVVVVPIYGHGSTVYSYHDDMVITMYPDPLPLEAGIAFRAQTFLDAYGAYVTSNGKAVLADTQKDVIDRAKEISPLFSAYTEYIVHLIAAKRLTVAVTADNFLETAKAVAPAFPITENWKRIGSEVSFVNPDSVVGGEGVIHYVVARRMTEEGSSWQFSRIKADCSSGSTELISTALLESGMTPRKVSELMLSDSRSQLPGETLQQSSVIACQLADQSLKPVIGVVPLDFPWGAKWTALKYTGNTSGVSEAFLENHIQLKLDDTIIVRGAWLNAGRGPKLYTVNWFHVDCAARKYGVVHWGTGNSATALTMRLVSEGKDDNPAMQDILPGTFQADLLDMACQKSKTMEAGKE